MWRTDKDTGEHYPVDSAAGSGMTDEAIQNIVNPKPEQTPGICGYCGSGATTVELPNGTYICESCFVAHFDAISADLNMSEDELMEILKSETSSIPTVQPSRVDDSKKCGRCGMTIPNYGRGGSREHWRQYHANESA